MVEILTNKPKKRGPKPGLKARMTTGVPVLEENTHLWTEIRRLEAENERLRRIVRLLVGTDAQDVTPK